MSEQTVAQQERASMADAMLALGVDSPTLCEGWTNYEMVGHVVVREHRPFSSLGITISALHSLHDNAIAKAKERHSFEALVDKFRKGPPLPWRPVDKLFNSQEYFIHHEDVRRGPGDNMPRPEEEIAAIEAEMWKMLRRAARFSTRGIKGIGVDLTRPDGETIHAKKGDDPVTIVGRPGEIVLYLVGRRGAAQVKLEGSPEAIAIAEGAKLGI